MRECSFLVQPVKPQGKRCLLVAPCNLTWLSITVSKKSLNPMSIWWIKQHCTQLAMPLFFQLFWKALQCLMDATLIACQIIIMHHPNYVYGATGFSRLSQMLPNELNSFCETVYVKFVFFNFVDFYSYMWERKYNKTNLCVERLQHKYTSRS